MITVTIAINDQVIYARSAVNKGYIDDVSDICAYAVDEGSTIEHSRGAGAIVLAKAMLDTIKEDRLNGK